MPISANGDDHQVFGCTSCARRLVRAGSRDSSGSLGERQGVNQDRAHAVERRQVRGLARLGNICVRARMQERQGVQNWHEAAKAPTQGPVMQRDSRTGVLVPGGQVVVGRDVVVLLWQGVGAQRAVVVDFGLRVAAGSNAAQRSGAIQCKSSIPRLLLPHLYGSCSRARHNASIRAARTVA